MSDTISKAIVKGHKKKYIANNYKRTKKNKVIDELPVKESMTYARNSYDMHNTEYKYALIRRFLNRMVGKHIDEVYSKYKQIIKDVSDNTYLNNPFRFNQWTKEYTFHGFTIDDNGLLKKEERKKSNANPYYLSIYKLNCKDYIEKDYIYVQFKGKEYFHNKHAWHEITVTKTDSEEYILHIQQTRKVTITEVKTRTLSRKEVMTLNLNPVLSFPDKYKPNYSYYNHNYHIYKLPNDYK